MKVYQYEKCESCKKAIRWLNEKKITFSSIPIREKIPTLSEDQIITLLQENGNLIRRPFVVGEKIALQGFKPDLWELEDFF